MLTIAEGCLFAAVVQAYGVLGMAKGKKGYDNANPRDPNYRKGLVARAYGAHNNGLEALPFFFGAVILAELHGANPMYINALALAFITVRCAYIWAYITNRPALRTPIWGVGMLLNIGIFSLPLWS